MTLIGHIERVRRYPVKSMRGEDLDAARITFSGVTGDRVHAFVDPAARPAFPWLTAREMPQLLRWQPHFVDAPDATLTHPAIERFQVVVRDPEGNVRPINDPGVLKAIRQACGREVWLRSSEKGMADAMPVSLISFDTIDAISVEAGGPADPLRFRANLYARWQANAPFAEDDLVGRTLTIGDTVELLVSRRDGRCVIVNLDPTTAASNPQVLKTIARGHEGKLGVYCVVLREGVIHPGDGIQLHD